MYSDSLTKEIEKIIKDNDFNCSIRNFKNKADWDWICRECELSEEFIDKFQDEIDWHFISQCQKLSESFIEKFQDKVKWNYISQFQRLSEHFIEKFQDEVYWELISRSQKLSEPFIEKFKDKVDLEFIIQFQKLSEPFIEKFKDRVDICYIAKFQKLSESFIKKFKDIIELEDNYGVKEIAKYQKFSKEFIKKYNLEIKNTNWLYKSVNFKLKYIKDHTDYEVIDDKYIIAYKGVRKDNYSKFNFQYKYEVGKIYEAHCDCNVDNLNSFGLSAWNIEKAKEYCNEKIIKVKIAIEDIGCIVKIENKIRCFKFEVLEERVLNSYERRCIWCIS